MKYYNLKQIKITTAVLIVLCRTSLNAQKIVSSFDSLIAFAANKSAAIKSGQLKLDQSKKAKLAAIYGIFDLTGSASFNITNNTKLPVSLFPAEAFGGEPGTYTEVQTGIKYNSTASIYGELKLINAAGWQNLKLSKINIESATIDNQLIRKNLFESICSNYYNIINVNEQLLTANKSIEISDTLYQIVASRHAVGLAKQQDLNVVKVNTLNAKEYYRQLKFVLQKQYVALKILCDIPESENLVIGQLTDSNQIQSVSKIQQNFLKLNSVSTLEKLSYNSFKQQKLVVLPTVSLFAANANQQFGTEFRTFDSGVKWINSNYIGVKASLVLPSANSIAQISKAKYDYLLCKENTEHALLESNLEYSVLKLDYQKALSQYETCKEVVKLQSDNYYRNVETYKSGIISLEQLMKSFNEMVVSSYNMNSATVQVLLAQSKIDINNNIK